MNRILALSACLAACLLLPAAGSAARLYKWTDKNGNVTYHDQPPPSDAYKVQQKQFPNEPPRDPNEIAASKSPVILYSASSCAMCDAARAFFARHRIPFTEKDVETNADLQKELKEKSGTLKVPTIMIGTTVFDGYVESILARELKTAGYQLDSKSEPGKETSKESSKENKDSGKQLDRYKRSRTY